MQQKLIHISKILRVSGNGYAITAFIAGVHYNFKMKYGLLVFYVETPKYGLMVKYDYEVVHRLSL